MPPHDDRIMVLSGGRSVQPTDNPPRFSSSHSSWRGFLLERHCSPPGELPRESLFRGHFICLGMNRPPVTKYWSENGRERSIAVGDGDIALVSNEAIIGCRWDGPHDMVVLAIDELAANNTVAECNVPDEVGFRLEPGFRDEALVNLVLAMHADAQAGCPTGRLLGESIGTTLAMYTFQRYGVARLKIPEYRDGLPRARLRRVIEYIESSLHQNLSITELAAIAGMSPYHFGKLFKSSMAVSVHQYVLNRRLHRARRLLARSDLSLVELAAQIGLPNQSHFTSLFKTRIGVTPTQYRRENKPTVCGRF
jgi:AraC family transcriptional regulator